MVESREGLYSPSQSDPRIEGSKHLLSFGVLGKADADLPKRIIQLI
jgi:hypothetical protein